MFVTVLPDGANQYKCREYIHFINEGKIMVNERNHVSNLHLNINNFKHRIIKFLSSLRAI